ncbi:hypothetical protein [Flavimaricola marinus]|uniref:Ferrochelatase n=1 Tax=Flavimaricola marinus TaxID=1819565 RepID=A0A238LFC2_9RHOB|nr:hypothetical protein [Flavimaricola marinus]SMY08331.1 hypothetical protein LOM8899_02482 [Flavimaricola marinus]
MRLTKTLIAAAIATTVAGSAMAGGFAMEIVEPPVVMIEEASGSSWGWVVPVVALAALAALALSEED